MTEGELSATTDGARRTVLLVHQAQVQHYRVPIYGYLGRFLAEHGYDLHVTAEGVEHGCPHPIEFNGRFHSITFASLRATVNTLHPSAVIVFVNLANHYLFPFLVFLRLKGIKAIYWGHGIDLEDRRNPLKRTLYALEHAIVHAILLYADSLLCHLSPRAQRKAFIANNTLNTTILEKPSINKAELLHRYGITSSRNIICVGRLEKRKRIDDLLSAHSRLAARDVGLILVGRCLDVQRTSLAGPHVYHLGPLYGQSVLEVLAASDVYCLPGHLGLGIVDAMYMGLPVVTEDVAHAPEIMYLKDGLNGFIVPTGDIVALERRLAEILFDADLHARMSAHARDEIRTNGHIGRMCEGFLQSLDHVMGVCRPGPSTSSQSHTLSP